MASVGVPSPPSGDPSSAKKRVFIVRRRIPDEQHSEDGDEQQSSPQLPPKKRVIKVVPRGSFAPGSETAKKIKEEAVEKAMQSGRLGGAADALAGPVSSHSVIGRPEDFVRQRALRQTAENTIPVSQYFSHLFLLLSSNIFCPRIPRVLLLRPHSSLAVEAQWAAHLFWIWNMCLLTCVIECCKSTKCVCR